MCWRSGRGEGHRFGFARITQRNTNSRAGNAGPKSCPACRRRTPALGHRDRRLRRPTACGDTAGLFLQLVAEMVAKNFAPVSTLAALKHPFASCGSDRNVFRRQVRQWEFEALRGPRPEPGLHGLIRSPGGMKPERHADAVSSSKLLKMRPAASPRQCPAGIFLSANYWPHISAAEALSADPAADGDRNFGRKKPVKPWPSSSANWTRRPPFLGRLIPNSTRLCCRR